MIQIVECSLDTLPISVEMIYSSLNWRSPAIPGTLLGSSIVLWRYSYNELKSARENALITKIDYFEKSVFSLFWSSLLYVVSIVGAISSTIGLFVAVSNIVFGVALLISSSLMCFGAFNSYQGMIAE
jgi:hypothetical protein